MTNKAIELYKEAEKVFENGDGSSEIDTLDNLCYLLEVASDDFLDSFTHEYHTELTDEYISENEEHKPSYVDPEIIFRLHETKDIYFTVRCSGYVCSRYFEHPKDSIVKITYPSCFTPIDYVDFHCPVNSNNEDIAQQFLDYFSSHFLQK